MPKLSVIIPVYNEAGTIRQIIEKISAVGLDIEIVVVDDGSTDGTDKILRSLRLDHLKVIHHSSNRGKGAAFLTGLSQASGELVIIQDADLEYDPAEYLKLVTALCEQKADLVLGCRFTKGYRGELVHRMGNMFLTLLINTLFKARLNDCFTCYKVMRRQTLESLALTSRGFELEIEIVSKALRRKLVIYEVPVSYHPRSYSEGKKIRIKDGLWAMLNILKYKFA